MPISLNNLASAAGRRSRMRTAANLFEAKTRQEQTAFLSHSHYDNKYIQGLEVLLREYGWNLYIDWKDNAMPDKPDRKTAERIQNKIEELDWFLFLATPNSTSSKWCPWEIGYADGVKDYDRIIVIPTTDQSGHWYGNEYLQLYRKIDVTTGQDLAAFPAGREKSGTFISALRS